MNLRRRDEEAKSEFLKFANLSLVNELVPVLDSFNLAIEHGHKDVEPVYIQLMSVLKQRGLLESNPIGETFDPRFHEALGIIHTERREEDHQILEVVQKGYIISGKILRPAKVRIGEYKN